MKRGAFSEIAMLKRTPGGFSFDSQLSKQDLNYFCLYWDELVIPENRLFSGHIHGEEAFIEAGFLKRPVFDGRNSTGDTHNFDYMQNIQKKAIKELRQRYKGTDWYINNVGQPEAEEDDGNIELPSLRMEMMRALPVPSEDIHVYEILEFKDKRRDELEKVHVILQELYREIIKSADPNIESAIAFSKLESALNDLNKTFYERWKKSVPYNLSIKKEISAADIYGAFNALGAMNLLHHGQIIPAMIQGAHAALPSILSRLIFKQRERGHTDLRYLTHASEIGIVKI